jgi:formylmethanofuran dehydrogenase subunit C
MNGYRFTWRHHPAGLIDGSTLRPDLLGNLPPEEVGRRPLRIGRATWGLGDVFQIDGGPGPRLILPGSPRYIDLGAGMAAGELLVEGHGGLACGRAMSGGMLRVEGSVGHGLGCGLRGGRIVVTGDAGDLIGGPAPETRHGMQDGEIVVLGRAGERIGHRMRRGLIVVGETGRYPGHQMLAGTIVVQAGPLCNPGVAMVRGTLITLDANAHHEWQPLFQYDCTFRPVILKILLGHLQTLGIDLPAGSRHGRFELWSGDRLATNKGEIFRLVGP